MFTDVWEQTSGQAIGPNQPIWLSACLGEKVLTVSASQFKKNNNSPLPATFGAPHRMDKAQIATGGRTRGATLTQ